ncbi:hypothetical protein ES708_27663 [subsurface metagenome]
MLIRGATVPQRLPKITTGQILRATATGYDGVAMPYTVSRVKPDDQIVNNSDVLINDEDLVFSVLANEVWLFDAVFIVSSETIDPKLDYLFDAPAGAAIGKMSNWSTTTTVVWVDGLVEATIPTSADLKYAQFRCLYIGAGAAGNIQLKWAQHEAIAENSRMQANSFLLATRLSP